MNYQGFQPQGAICQQYLSPADHAKLRTSLIGLLNKQRTAVRKKKLHRCRRGDGAAQEMIEADVESAQDGNFQASVGRHQLCADSVELAHIEINHARFSQIPTEQEARDAFQAAFEAMCNNSQSQLLSQDIFSHVSLGFKQHGQNGEFFKITALLQKKALAVLLVASATSPSGESAKIFVGQIIDRSKLPMMAIINKGKQSELKLGSSNMLYDPAQGDEFKFWYYENEIQGVSPFNDAGVAKEQVTADVYMVEANNTAPVAYGQGRNDMTHVFPEQCGWHLCYSDRIAPTVKETQLTPQQALSKSGLAAALTATGTAARAPGQPPARLLNRLPSAARASASSIATQAAKQVQNVVQHIQPRKTRAQLLMEQKSQEVRDRQQTNQNQRQNTVIALGNGPSTAQPFASPFHLQTQQYNQQPVTNFASQNTSQPRFQSNFAASNQQTLNFAPRAPEPFPKLQSQANLSTMVQQNQNINQNERGNVSFGYAPPGNFENNSSQNKSTWNTNNQSQFNGFNPSNSNQIPSSSQMNLPKQSQPSSFPEFRGSMGQTTNVLQGQKPLQFNFNPASVNQTNLRSGSDGFNNGNKIAFQPFKGQNIGGLQDTSSSAGGQSKLGFKPLTPVITKQQPQFVQQQSQSNPALQQPQYSQPAPSFQPFLPHYQPPLQQQLAPQPQAVAQQVPAFQPLIVQPRLTVPDQAAQNMARLRQATDYLGLDQAVLLSYYQELQLQLSTDERERLDLIFQTDPCKFVEVVQKAHQTVADMHIQGQSTEEIEANRRREFREKVLYSNDIGEYLLRICDYVERAEVKYDQAIENAAKNFVSSKENNSEAICLSILKFLILGEQQPPKNESFRQLYDDYVTATNDKNSREAISSDLTLLHQGKRYRCHQFVFKNSSKFFENIINQNERLELQKQKDRRVDYLSRQRLELPEWISPQALKLFIKFLYLGSISDQSLDYKSIFDFYQAAAYFKHPVLEDQIVVEGLIPQMSLRSALHILKGLQRFKDVERESRVLLQDYCSFYLAKHLASQLRSSKKDLHDLEKRLLSCIVQRAFLHVKGDDQLGTMDLELIIDFAAEIIADKDIYKLLDYISSKFKHCMAFDTQKVKKIREFMLSSDHQQSYFCNLIDCTSTRQAGDESHDSSGSQTVLAQVPPSAHSDKTEVEKTFVQKEPSLVVHQGKSSLYQDLSIEQMKPKSNFVCDSNGKPVSKEQMRLQKRQACNQVSLGMSKIRQEIREGSNGLGMTYLSEAFDKARRSWYFKVDVEAKENVSLWLVERGQPVGDNSLHENFQIPSYSSVIVEFEMQQKTIGERTSSMFFSFAHNTNQIVGHKNFINLSKLRASDEITFSVYIKEYFIHSSIMHTLSHSFSKLYQQDYNDTVRNASIYGAHRRSLFTMPFYTIYHLLQSNSLKVDDENTVLGFVFHYVQKIGEHYPLKIASAITEVLVGTLRYNFLCLRKILSAIRRSELLRTCPQFISLLKMEMNYRVASQENQHAQLSTLMSSWDNQRLKSKSEEEDVPEEARQFYDTIKVSNQGRNKQEMDAAKTGTLGLLEEVVTWAITANAPTDKSAERERHRELNDQERMLTRKEEERAREVREARKARGGYHHDQYQHDYDRREDKHEIARLKIELEELRQAQEKFKMNHHNPYLRAGTMKDPNIEPRPQHAAARPLPRFLSMNKENVEPANSNSFHSLGLNHSLNKHQDTAAAERKIHGARMSADFSRILKQIDLSPVKGDNSLQLNPQPVQMVPRNPLLNRASTYQMRTRIPTVSSQAQNENNCILF